MTAAQKPAAASKKGKTTEKIPGNMWFLRQLKEHLNERYLSEEGSNKLLEKLKIQAPMDNSKEDTYSEKVTPTKEGEGVKLGSTPTSKETDAQKKETAANPPSSSEGQNKTNQESAEGQKETASSPEPTTNTNE